MRQTDPYEIFEALIKKAEWSGETEEQLQELLESHETDLYMMYLTYNESGLVDELSEYERRVYQWLDTRFGKLSDESS